MPTLHAAGAPCLSRCSCAALGSSQRCVQVQWQSAPVLAWHAAQAVTVSIRKQLATWHPQNTQLCDVHCCLQSAAFSVLEACSLALFVHIMNHHCRCSMPKIVEWPRLSKSCVFARMILGPHSVLAPIQVSQHDVGENAHRGKLLTCLRLLLELVPWRVKVYGALVTPHAVQCFMASTHDGQIAYEEWPAQYLDTAGNIACSQVSTSAFHKTCSR